MQLFTFIAEHPGPHLPGEITGFSSTVAAESLAQAQALAAIRCARVQRRTGRTTRLAGVSLVSFTVD